MPLLLLKLYQILAFILDRTILRLNLAVEHRKEAEGMIIISIGRLIKGPINYIVKIESFI